MVYRIGDYVWYHVKGKKIRARLKKKVKDKWRLNYRWTDGVIYTHEVDEDDIEPKED